MKRVIPFVLLLISCGPGKEKEKTQTSDSTAVDANGEKIVRSLFANGKVRSEIPYKNGKKNGIARTYAQDGSLILELPYVDGSREGTSKKYYADGKTLAQTTEYKNDKMNGIQARYRGNGNLMSEARFVDDSPCNGLREYLENKSLKKKYPTIEIKVQDNLNTTGVYKLKISMSERVRAVKFYEGDLTKDGCIGDDLNYLLLDEATKTAEISYRLPPGGFVMEELNIVATYETLMGNTAIAVRKYHVAIDNK